MRLGKTSTIQKKSRFLNNFKSDQQRSQENKTNTEKNMEETFAEEAGEL